MMAALAIRRLTPLKTLSARLISTVSEVLQGQIEEGKVHQDAAQQRVAKRLSKLQRALQGYSNHDLVSYHDERFRIELERLKQEKGRKKDQPSDREMAALEELPDPPTIRMPRGLYIFGNVGTGKSMLMDLFYSLDSVPNKRRVHFHAFLQDVHQRIFQLKQQHLESKGRDFHVDTSIRNNPIVRVGKQLASEVSLLCFDEFQVTDVADALILKQLFSTLFQHGTVVVATSNRPPTDLYEGGINRSYFLPFIDVLQHYCLVHELSSELDYRKLLSENVESLFFVSEPLSAHEVYTKLMGGKEETTTELNIGFGRSFVVKQCHADGLVARFDFEELCEHNNLGAADYRALAQQFDAIFLENIPRLTLKKHNEARRFITLIDELYEANCAMICVAEFPPDELFLASDHNDDSSTTNIELKVGEAFGIDIAQSTGRSIGDSASVRELRFAFQRAASRLTEMCSRRWWDNVLQ